MDCNQSYEKKTWSNDYWNMVSSILIITEAVTTHARQTINSIFCEDSLRDNWRNCIEFARNIAIDAQRYLGNGSTTEIFSLPESLRGDSPPRREAGKRVAGTITAGVGGSSGHHHRQGDLSTPLTLAIRGRGDGYDLEYRDDGIANAILTGGRAGIGVGAVAFSENQRAEITPNDTAGSLKSGGGKPGQGYPALHSGMSVRRLTPDECEALQGFPKSYTNITYRGKPAADGSRYKALGNSMAVPVMRWIGERIAMVEDIVNQGEYP